MLLDLRRVNFIGDVDGIQYLVHLIGQESGCTVNSLLDLCALASNIRLNVKAALTYLELLNFITIDADAVSLTDSGTELSKSNRGRFCYLICRVSIKQLLDIGGINLTGVSFDLQKRMYRVQPHSFSISVSVFRNVLILFGALTPDSSSYFISREYEKFFAECAKVHSRQLSLEALKAQQRRNEEQGAIGEKFVLEYEKARLAGTGLEDLVKQISDIDVGAGYDIVSFANGDSADYDRFIEVKTYVGEEHFYWSSNEIEKAKLLRNQYVLILVDANRINEHGYKPVEITNPSENIISCDQWRLTATSYFVDRHGVENSCRTLNEPPSESRASFGPTSTKPL